MADVADAPLAEIFPLRGKRVYVAGHRGMVGSVLKQLLWAALN